MYFNFKKKEYFVTNFGLRFALYVESGHLVSVLCQNINLETVAVEPHDVT